MPLRSGFESSPGVGRSPSVGQDRSESPSKNRSLVSARLRVTLTATAQQSGPDSCLMAVEKPMGPCYSKSGPNAAPVRRPLVLEGVGHRHRCRHFQAGRTDRNIRNR